MDDSDLKIWRLNLVVFRLPLVKTENHEKTLR